MKNLLVFVLALFALPMVAQIEEPPTKMPGPIGPGGASFPLFNAGTITLSGSTYNLTTYPNTSASVIRFVGTLSAPCVITARPAIGFQYTIINETQGGQDIVFKTAAGTGVTIPAGHTALVVSDGTNYVPVSGAEGGGGGPGPGPGPTVEAPIYSQAATFHMNTPANQSNVLTPSCPSNFCVMATPTANGTYRFSYEIVQITPGAGCTTGGGTVRVNLGYKNPDNHIVYAAITAMRLISATTVMMNALGGVVPDSANGITNSWVSVPLEFHAEAGTNITMNLFQNNGSDCATQPEFIIRPALYAMGAAAVGAGAPLRAGRSAGARQSSTVARSSSSYGPIYSTELHAEFNSAGASTPLTLTGQGCASNICTILTPTADETYHFTYEVVQSTAGADCTGGGGLWMYLSYTNPDTNIPYRAMLASRGISGGINMLNAFGPATNAPNGMSTSWVAVPFDFKAKQGVPITLEMIQSTSPAGCSTMPILIVRPALYATGH